MDALESALVIKHTIENSYNHAIDRLNKSIEQANCDLKKYWIERVKHLIGELNWIDNEILKIKNGAVAYENETAPFNNGDTK